MPDNASLGHIGFVITANAANPVLHPFTLLSTVLAYHITFSNKLQEGTA
jgi:hypothetical protein